ASGTAAKTAGGPDGGRRRRPRAQGAAGSCSGPAPGGRSGARTVGSVSTSSHPAGPVANRDERDGCEVTDKYDRTLKPTLTVGTSKAGRRTPDRTRRRRAGLPKQTHRVSPARPPGTRGGRRP